MNHKIPQCHLKRRMLVDPKCGCFTYAIYLNPACEQDIWGGSEGSGWQRACSQAVLHLVRCVHFRYIKIFCFLRSICSLVCKFNYMGHNSQLREGK